MKNKKEVKESPSFKTPMTSWLIMLGGLGFAVFMFVRYNDYYPDLDKAIAYAVIGFFMFGFGWCHQQIARLNRLRELDLIKKEKEDEDQWKYLDHLEMKIDKVEEIV